MVAEQGEAPGGPGLLTFIVQLTSWRASAVRQHAQLPADIAHVSDPLQCPLQAAPESGDPLLTPACAVKLPVRNCAPSVSLSVRPVQLPLRDSAPAVHSSPWPAAGNADGAQGQCDSLPHCGPADAGAAADHLVHQQQGQPPVAMQTSQQRQQDSSGCTPQQQPAQEHGQADGPGGAVQCSRHLCCLLLLVAHCGFLLALST